MAQGNEEVAQIRERLDALANQLVAGGRQINSLRRLSGGASQEMWSFDVQGVGDTTPMILRRAPGGNEQASTGHAGYAAEARLNILAAQAGVPVPRIHLLLEPHHGLGSGFIMQRLEGEALGRKIVSDPHFAQARARLAWQCGAALATMHRIDASQVPGLRHAPAGDEFAHYVERHRSYGHSRPVFELAIRWLEQNLPDTSVETTLVHGDFRNGNLLVNEDGLCAVLDWELAHLGDPMEDLGWICVNSWRYGNIDKPVGGFGEREELFAGYESAGGRVHPDRVRFWEILGSLKWGIMCEGMVHTYLSGTERNIEKLAIGRRASEAEIDLLRLLAPRGNR
nr:phosphotransferase family protein [Pseudomonas sp.]